MKNVSTMIVGIVVVAVCAMLYLMSGSESPSTYDGSNSSQNTGGQRAGLQEYSDGIKLGDVTTTWKRVVIPSGSNQAAWYNNLGKTVFVTPDNVMIGFPSGTATSTLVLYVGTSTSSTFTDYARPSVATLLVDGALVATSTSAGTTGIYKMGTTSVAANVFAVPAGGYLVFDVQERFACKSDGSCNTATSSNRGIDSLHGYFRLFY